MSVENTIHEKPVKITNNGMITIPPAFRKKFNLKDGDKVLILEDQGTLRIIPIRSDTELRRNSYSSEDMKEISEIIKNEE
jgi:AbrB family looped-hinge helix DNA binding protein